LKTAKEFETIPSITGRLGLVEYMLSDNTTGVTKSQRTNKAIVQEEYVAFQLKLSEITNRLKEIEMQLEKSKIPYIKGNYDSWKKD
jgi:hypothetical protein